MKKIYIDTLGCAKNEYDSQVLSAALMDKGCEIVYDPEEADVMLVNTCGFIDDAKTESIDRIFELAELRDDDRKLVVTGCLSQRYHEELVNEMPEVDVFFGVNDYDRMPDIIMDIDKAKAKAGTSAGLDAVGCDVIDMKYRKRDYSSYIHTGVLKIAEGCNNSCSFCAIPAIRGKYRSKTIEDCIREANDMAHAGIKELVLIAQDTSQYGKDIYGRIMLPELLTELCKIEGIEWIRMMYVYDNCITDELIDVMAKEPKICNYVDMPIQHVSDHVLNLMKRQSTGASIVKTINKLRERIPDIHIRTTILVGFPGETEEDFNELIDFIDTMKIDRLGAFAFSDEEGTASFAFPDKIDDETKIERRNAVMEHQLKVSEAINEKKIGKVLEVMVDEEAEEGIYIGRTRYDSPEIDCEVSFSTNKEHYPGDVVQVKIINAYEYDIEGEEI